jgi:hypothetical protein
LRRSTLGMDPLCRHLADRRLARAHLRHASIARGQAENLIKRHKTQLASDRTSCRSANANQMPHPHIPPPTG